MMAHECSAAVALCGKGHIDILERYLEGVVHIPANLVSVFTEIITVSSGSASLSCEIRDLSRKQVNISFIVIKCIFEIEKFREICRQEKYELIHSEIQDFVDNEEIYPDFSELPETVGFFDEIMMRMQIVTSLLHSFKEGCDALLTETKRAVGDAESAEKGYWWGKVAGYAAAVILPLVGTVVGHPHVGRLAGLGGIGIGAACTHGEAQYSEAKWMLEKLHGDVDALYTVAKDVEDSVHIPSVETELMNCDRPLLTLDSLKNSVRLIFRILQAPDVDFDRLGREVRALLRPTQLM